MEQTYTEPVSIINRLKRHMEERDITAKDIAARIGKSRSLVSQYLNGTYKSDTTDIEDAITCYLDGCTADEEAPEQTVDRDFYMTRDAKQILAICRSCQENRALGAIVGRSGYGKTHALKHYATFSRVVRIECDDSMGARDLVDAICSALGLPLTYGSIYRRTAVIKEFFKINKGYLLIVDEADKLITKHTQKKIEILRSIYDQSDMGLVIAGEPALETMLRSYDVRFANRIDFYGSLQGLSRDEVREYLTGIELEPRALEELVTRATNHHTGCFRLFNRTLKNVFRLAGSERITVKDIERASAMMIL